MCNDRISPKHIAALMGRATLQDSQMGAKTTVVVASLPNGFELVASSSCVDPDNYDHQIGRKLCLQRIEDQLWQLEGYLLQHYRSLIPTVDHPVPQRHMPPHCGTCRWSDWNEDGPRCRCLDRIPMDRYDYLIDDDLDPNDIVIEPEYDEDGGDIDYDDICGHYVHRDGTLRTSKPSESEMEAHGRKVAAYLRSAMGR
jgi:hypothetical protein